MKSIARRTALAALTGCAVSGMSGAWAQTFPSRSMRLISPFSAGGAIDLMSRLLAETMGQRLKQTIVVENMPGANTIVAAQALARAPGDGHTFMVTTMSTVLNNRFVFKKLPYNPDVDLVPISQVAYGSMLLAGPANAEYKNLQQFIAWSKRQKRAINIGLFGVGSLAHAYVEMLKRDHGVEFVPVVYKGEGPAILDVMSGLLDASFSSPVIVKAQMSTGKLLPLGMLGPMRSPAMLDLATFSEQKVPGMETPLWVGAFAPKDTPESAVNTLQQALAYALALPQVASRIAELGFVGVGSSPTEFSEQIKREVRTLGPVFEGLGVRLDS